MFRCSLRISIFCVLYDLTGSFKKCVCARVRLCVRVCDWAVYVIVYNLLYDSSFLRLLSNTLSVHLEKRYVLTVVCKMRALGMTAIIVITVAINMGKMTLVLLVLFVFNPFTAPACKLSGLKDARARLQTVHFPVL